jgi:hypothetical protein
MSLTKKELFLAQSLLEEIEEVEGIIRSFTSQYVRTTVGLVDINSASKHEAQKCDAASILHSRYEDIEKELERVCKDRLEMKLSDLKIKLSPYIKDWV